MIFQMSYTSFICLYEPAHVIMVLFVLRKLVLQSHMRSHPVGLDVWFFVRPFVYFHTLLAWAFAGCLCDKYHNLMSRLMWPFFFFYKKTAPWVKALKGVFEVNQLH